MSRLVTNEDLTTFTIMELVGITLEFKMELLEFFELFGIHRTLKK